jgi:hypothetical protein
LPPPRATPNGPPEIDQAAGLAAQERDLKAASASLTTNIPGAWGLVPFNRQIPE